MRAQIECACCGQEGTLQGHGYITACYHRWRKAGYPESGPPSPPLAGAELAAEYALLRDSGETHETACARLGVAKSTGARLRRGRDGKTGLSIAEKRQLRARYLELRGRGVGRHQAAARIGAAYKSTYNWEPGVMKTRPRKVSA